MERCRPSLNTDNSMGVRCSSGLPPPARPARTPGSCCAKQNEEETSSNAAMVPRAGHRMVREFKVLTPVLCHPGSDYGTGREKRPYGVLLVGLNNCKLLGWENLRAFWRPCATANQELSTRSLLSPIRSFASSRTSVYGGPPKLYCSRPTRTWTSATYGSSKSVAATPGTPARFSAFSTDI